MVVLQSRGRLASAANRLQAHPGTLSRLVPKSGTQLRSAKMRGLIGVNQSRSKRSTVEAETRARDLELQREGMGRERVIYWMNNHF